MSRFRKLSHGIWHCHYHIVWVPKYRLRILTGDFGQEVGKCIRTFCEQLKCEVVELSVQVDHVHLLVMIPPKVSISEFMGTVKGRTAIRVLNKFRHLKRRPYWGNHFRPEAIAWIRWAWTKRRFVSMLSTKKTVNTKPSRGSQGCSEI